jgi:hypothetical protein
MTMKIQHKFRMAARIAAAGAAAMLLSSCFLSPGKFDAALDLRQDGGFSFQYRGQIYLMALSEFAKLADAADKDEFEAYCFDDETYEDRECTAEETAEQRSEWEEKQAKDEGESEAMMAMLGGIDPGDPEAAAELAKRLEKQRGWRKVTYSGDGLFEVDFAIASRIDHDFAFPTIEQFPMANFFVVATRRQDGAVRIDAPGFAQQAGSNPMQGFMSGMAGFMAAGEDSKEDLPKIPEMEGTFRIVTDGEILANNTNEGPVAMTNGRQLSWEISKRTQQPPMALIRLAN